MRRIACVLRVTGRGGRPLAGMMLVVEQASAPVPEMAYVTDDAGGARLGLPPGPAVIRFFRGDYSRRVTLTIEDAPDRTYEVVLEDA